MDFVTKVLIPTTDKHIAYTSHLAFFGSCFADNISALFKSRKFNVFANPFGTVYNPISIASAIRNIADCKTFKESDVFEDKRASGTWHCWDAHSSLSGTTQEECIAKLNESTNKAFEFLQKTDIVFITLGTAFVYFLKENYNGVKIPRVVSNCHRQDPKLFERRLISVEEAKLSLESIVRDLQQINSKIKIVFTVSPLRHMSDGAHGNTISKSTLQLAVSQVIEEFKTADNQISVMSKSVPQNCSSNSTIEQESTRLKKAKPNFITSVDYFPSYEIVMDELRDYRFYDDDMIHLSKIAEAYIFERMIESYCSKQTCEDIHKVEKFMKSVNHRIEKSHRSSVQFFAQQQIELAIELEKQINGLNLYNEKKLFQNFFDTKEPLKIDLPK